MIRPVRFSCALAALLAMLVLGACSGPVGPVAPDGSRGEPAAPHRTGIAAARPAPVNLTLRLGSTDTGSSHYAYAVAEAGFLSARIPGLTIDVVVSGGGVDNVERLVSHEFDLAAATTESIAYQAYHGLGRKRWEGKPRPELRWLWTYTVSSRAIIVAADSKVRKLADLDGKKLNPGIRGSATEADFISHMNILGIKPDYVRGGTEDALAAIRDREIVGYVKAQPGNKLDASTAELRTFRSIRIIGYSDDEIAKIRAQRPWDHWVTLKKDALYPGSPEVKTLASSVGTITTTGVLPNDVAYAMVKLLNEGGLEEIAQSVSFVKGWKLAAETVSTAKIPLHPGVLRYVRELGLPAKPEQVPPEAS